MVYEVPCLDCPQVYIGETGRTLQKRVAEHRTAVKKGNHQNNDIAVHAWDSKHRIDWEEAKVRVVAPYYWERRETEALIIQQQGSTMNLDCGLYVNPIWKPIIPTLIHHHDSGTHQFNPCSFSPPFVCLFTLMITSFKLHHFRSITSSGLHHRL